MVKSIVGIFIVGKVVIIIISLVCTMGFQLKEYKRYTIYKAYYIGPAVIEFPYYLQLPYSQEMILGRIIKIEYT